MIDGILSQYNTSDLVGIIVPKKALYSIISEVTPAILRTNYDGTQSWGNANFIDNSGSPLDIALCFFNKQFLHQAAGLYTYNGTNLTINTDGTPNVVNVLGFDSTFGFGFDSLTFGAAPLITNIVRGQNISRDSSITVNWTGTSSDFVNINVFVWDTTGTSDTIGLGYAVGGYFNNTGAVTLSLIPQQLKLGLADVELTKYEPKFFTLSSGKRICVVCETSDDITVHIVN
jgi:hypothetical protein